MRARGITSEQGVLQELGVIFGNRTASSLFSLMFLQQEKIAKNMALSKNAMGTDELIKLTRSSPQGADMALAATGAACLSSAACASPETADATTAPLAPICRNRRRS